MYYVKKKILRTCIENRLKPVQIGVFCLAEGSGEGMVKVKSAHQTWLKLF